MFAWAAIVLAFLTYTAQTAAASSPDPLGDILSIVDKFGVVGVMTISIVAFVREDVVPGKRYKACLVERDMWKDLALKGTLIASDAVSAAETLTKVKER